MTNSKKQLGKKTHEFKTRAIGEKRPGNTSWRGKEKKSRNREIKSQKEEKKKVRHSIYNKPSALYDILYTVYDKHYTTHVRLHFTIYPLYYLPHTIHSVLENHEMLLKALSQFPPQKKAPIWTRIKDSVIAPNGKSKFKDLHGHRRSFEGKTRARNVGKHEVDCM